MPMGDIMITITCERLDSKRQDSVSFRIPANGALGVAIAPDGKTKIGTKCEQLGTLVDENRSDL